MNLNASLETSIAVKLLRGPLREYGYFEELFGSASESSLTCNIILKFWEKLRIYFKYSFLGRASERRKKDITLIISESKLLKRIKDSYSKLKNSFSFYFSSSILNKPKEELKNYFDPYPFKAIGAIIIVATLTNILLTILLKKELTLLSWIIRALFLFAGLAGVNSYAAWPAILNEGIILKLIIRKKCAGSVGK